LTKGVKGALKVDSALRSGLVFEYLIWEIKIMLHTHMKQMALMVVTTVNACSGISLLNNAPIDTTIVDVNKALLGTAWLFNFSSLAGASPFLLNV
jgi:hypothetical protein